VRASALRTRLTKALHRGGERAQHGAHLRVAPPHAGHSLRSESRLGIRSRLRACLKTRRGQASAARAGCARSAPRLRCGACVRAHLAVEGRHCDGKRRRAAQRRAGGAPGGRRRGAAWCLARRRARGRGRRTLQRKHVGHAQAAVRGLWRARARRPSRGGGTAARGGGGLI
jgi:hypothetical protein